MATETDFGKCLRQQILIWRFVRPVTFDAEPLFGRLMDHQGVCINFSFMTFETEPGGGGLEQGFAGAGVPTVTIQAGPIGGRFMGAATAARAGLSLFMTLQADRCRRFGQHAGILAGMRGMTTFAFSLFDRVVL
jgi:hypothetical protein